jgi:hypothetical protein
MTQRRAYTMIELAMVMVVAAIVIIAAVGTKDNSAKEEAKLIGETFENDVTFARNESIAHPDDPVVIKVDTAANKYWLARSSEPDKPMAHPRTGKDYVVQCGPAGKSSVRNVQIVGVDFGGDSVLAFDVTGSTDQPTPAILQLSSGGADYEVRVAPAAAQTMTSVGFTMNLASPGTGGSGTMEPEDPEEQLHEQQMNTLDP